MSGPEDKRYSPKCFTGHLPCALYCDVRRNSCIPFPDVPEARRRVSMVHVSAHQGEGPDGSRFATRAFFVLAALAVLSVAVGASGKRFGGSMALAGYTDDPTPIDVIIGKDVVVAPANTIRFDSARRSGHATRLDLYLRWPTLEGYTPAGRDDFNNVGGKRNILFLSFEERMMSRDMSGRFDPIYRTLIDWPGQPGQAGLTFYEFSRNSGYLDESLAVALREGADPFVARCLEGEAAENSLAPCERDVDIGGNLSLTYRFARELLPEWRILDAVVTARAVDMVKTGRAQAVASNP